MNDLKINILQNYKSKLILTKLSRQIFQQKPRTRRKGRREKKIIPATITGKKKKKRSLRKQNASKTKFLILAVYKTVQINFCFNILQ